MFKETICAILVALSSLYYQSATFIKPHYERTVQMIRSYINQTKNCGVCNQEIGKYEQDVIATGCNGEFHMSHTNCMKQWIEQNHFNCPTCNVQLSEAKMDYILFTLNGDVDPVAVETNECSICLDNCDGVWPYNITLHCSNGEHQFHTDCLYEATQRHEMKGCPNCRSNINDEDMRMLKDAYQFRQFSVQ